MAWVWRHTVVMDWLHIGKITATLTGETLEVSVAKCCLQRGILLPHSWEASL